jgi:hypothetical protein
MKDSGITEKAIQMPCILQKNILTSFSFKSSVQSRCLNSPSRSIYSDFFLQEFTFAKSMML